MANGHTGEKKLGDDITLKFTTTVLAEMADKFGENWLGQVIVAFDNHNAKIICDTVKIAGKGDVTGDQIDKLDMPLRKIITIVLEALGQGLYGEDDLLASMKADQDAMQEKYGAGNEDPTSLDWSS